LGIDWHWISTTAVAVYGAGLSTYNMYNARRKDRREIKVTISAGYLTHGPDLSDEMFVLSASNPGHRAVTVTSVGIRLPDGRQMVFPYPEGPQLPYHLTEGTNCDHVVPIREIARKLSTSGFRGTVKIKAFYRDAVENVHTSKPLSLKSTNGCERMARY